MATVSPQLERPAVVAGVQQTLRQLLAELGSSTAEALQRPADVTRLHLERELGLGSLERVELLLRLSQVFGVRLPDRVLAEADTVEDVVRAVLAEAERRFSPSARAAAVEPGEAERRAPAHWPAPHTGWRPTGEPPLRPVEEAETLVEVLWQRGRDAATRARPHIFLYEDAAVPPHNEPRTITNEELLGRALAVARRLREKGLEPGERVALMLPTGRAFFTSFAGTMLAGGVPVPIYPPVRADRIEEYAERQAAILRNAEARLLITFGQAGPVARLMKPLAPSLAAVVDAAGLDEPAAAGDGAADAEELPPVRGEDIAFLQYTSGSTGDPKGVVLTHANLLANLRAIIAAVGVRPDDVGVGWLPLYHDMGLIGTWLMPLTAGIPTVILSPLAFLARPERWLWAVARHRGTLSAAPNFAFELCVRKISPGDVAGLDLRSWRAALNGAEPVSATTLERFAQRFAPCGLRREALAPVYGLAEATLAVTVPPMGRGPWAERVAREPFERDGRAVAVEAAGDPGETVTFVSSGRPIPGFEVRLVTDTGTNGGAPRAIEEDGLEGRLHFRGPSATRGYFRNPRATAEICLEDGWVDSGDRAYRRSGEYFITGRAKDVIIKAGRNIAPQEVEDIVAGVEGVRKGCVVAFAAADETSGTERLVVAAEVRDPAALRGDARAALAARVGEAVSRALGLPPDQVELVAAGSIPKTSSGKLRRSETKRLFLEGKLGARRRPPWLQVARLAAGGALRAAAGGTRRLLEKLYGVYFLVVFVLWLVPTWAVMMMLPTRRAVVLWTSRASRLFFYLVGVPIRVVGRENIRKDGCALVSNHTSYLDVLVLMAALPIEFRFVSKIEVHKMPLIGSFLRRRGDLSFDRSDRAARLEQVSEVEASLQRGDAVWVFPEGTFTPREGVRPFQLGAFKAAVATGRPVVPVALAGIRGVLRDETILPRPGRVTITILPPIAPQPAAAGRDWPEIVRLRDATRAALAPHTGEPLL